MAFGDPIGTHMLEVVRGWPADGALEFYAKKDPAVLYDLRAGQCCHLDATTKKLQPGVGYAQMPLFIMQGSADLDTDTTSYNEWIPGTPSGNIMCLVGTGGFQLETTEYNTALTYNVGDLLKSPTGNAAVNETTTPSGILSNASITLYTTPVVGHVCGTVYKNKRGYNVLPFWTVYLPGSAANAAA